MKMFEFSFSRWAAGMEDCFNPSSLRRIILSRDGGSLGGRYNRATPVFPREPLLSTRFLQRNETTKSLMSPPTTCPRSVKLPFPPLKDLYFRRFSDRIKDRSRYSFQTSNERIDISKEKLSVGIAKEINRNEIYSIVI